MLKDTSEPVLYRRASLSDSLEGLADTIQIAILECQRIRRMYPLINGPLVVNYAAFGNIEARLQSLEGMEVYQLRQMIEQLRSKGL